MMKKRMSLLLAGAMLASTLAGCGGNGAQQGGGDTTTPANTDKPAATQTGAAFKIGGHGPLTGAAAIYGNAAKNGAQIAVDEINAMGGLQLELKYEDDEHDPEKAANAYNALKDWGMQLSLGGVTSKPAEVTSSDHSADGIFALTPSASSVAVIEGKDNVFQMCFTDPNQGTAAAKYIATQKLGTKVAIIYQNDEVYSTGIRDKFIEEAKAQNLEVVTESTFTKDSATDFSVQLNDAKAKEADLIFLPIYYTPASLILAQANGMGYAPKFFGVDGMDGILTVENFDTKLAEGVMLLTPFNADATDDKTKSFVEKYKTAYGEVPNQFAADAYDCVYAYKQALENAKATPDMAADALNELMKEQFTTMTFDGLTGAGMTWSKTGEVSKEPKGMVIKDGAYVGM